MSRSVHEDGNMRWSGRVLERLAAERGGGDLMSMNSFGYEPRVYEHRPPLLYLYPRIPSHRDMSRVCE